MKKMGLIGAILSLVCCCSCEKELVEYRQGDLRVQVEQGEAWLHDFPLFMGIKRKNAPQIAIWIEDMQGRYLSTVYVTHRIATQSWIAAKGNRRREALPHWCYSRGVQYEDGLYLPTKDQPFTDGVSGATPRGSFSMKVCPSEQLKQFVVKIEVNHSTDFNDAWPEYAAEGDPGWSGGKMGSGQPAVVYAATVDRTSGSKLFEAVLVGHSSPDGTTGEVDADVSQLTTALQIVKRITVEVL